MKECENHFRVKRFELEKYFGFSRQVHFDRQLYLSEQ